MPKAELLKIYETYRQANIILENNDDTVTPNEKPGGVLELQPASDGKYYHPGDPNNPDNNKQQIDAEGPGGPEEGEDWRSHMTRNIVAKGSDFLRAVYELGYTGEAGDADVNEVVELLAQEAEADERLKQALDAVITHMVNAGHADS